MLNALIAEYDGMPHVYGAVFRAIYTQVAARPRRLSWMQLYYIQYTCICVYMYVLKQCNDVQAWQ